MLQTVQDIYLATSTVAGVTPTSGMMQLGEIAFNTADQLMFVGTGNGAYITVPLTGGLGGGGAPTTTSGLQIGGAAPATPARGELWVDTTNPSPAIPEVKIWNGATWTVLATPDGSTIVRDAVTGELKADHLDMGVMP